MRSCARQSVPVFARSLVCSFVRACVRACVRAFVRSFVAVPNSKDDLDRQVDTGKEEKTEATTEGGVAVAVVVLS